MSNLCELRRGEMGEHLNSNIIMNYLMGQGVVAYQRGLARAVGDHSAGLLLSQFWYWAEHLPQEREGWFFMTQEQIYEETVMTRREQETARRKLRDLGILEEKKRGVPAKLWYRINTQAVVVLLENHIQSQYGGNRHTREAETAMQERRKPPGLSGGFRHTISKNTTKITSENTAAEATDASLPQNQIPLEDSAAAILAKELINHDVNRTDALRLASTHADECRRQLTYLPFKIAEIGGEQNFTKGKGAYLRAAIEGGFAPPREYKSVEERQKKKQQHQTARHQQDVRTAHQTHFWEPYRGYLRQVETVLAKDCKEAYEAFQIQTQTTRARLEKLSVKKPLEAFNAEEAHLERLIEFFSVLPDCPILTFWQWDERLNPESFCFQEEL